MEQVLHIFDVSNLTVNHTPLSASNTLHIVAHIQCLVIKTGGYEGSIGLRILKDSTEISAIELRSKNYAYNSVSSSGVRDCVNWNIGCTSKCRGYKSNYI